MSKLLVSDLDLKGKKVLIRVDFNVPIVADQITDDNRIKAALPTIEYVINEGGKAILFSHLGRVKTAEDKENNSLYIVKTRLAELLNKDVIFVPETRGKLLETEINHLQNGDVLLVENTRFEDVDGKKESKNDQELGKYWASLGDLFVNDAFGTAHRSHASNVGIASNIGSCAAGFLLAKEIDFIGGAISNPKRPLVAVLGGAKVSDKISVIENLLKLADQIIIGGGMAYTFLKALGHDVGGSLVELDKCDLALELLKQGKDKIVLPIDFAFTKEFKDLEPAHYGTIDTIKEGEMSLDIGPKSIAHFTKILKEAKTIIWNGPMGVFEFEHYNLGTKGILKALAENKEAITIIGGGDSASAAINFGYQDAFSHISTGGGASLEYLEGKKLPGIECVSEK
ncbi:MAG: phosphoglycerate kinase [Acholeplasmatales bacterium]|jgi:phosphoglycerate kinase|nr:phosphoglycerate kinase [Acholeplasmataceae bacterium]MDY0115529.1 phosphoglycerate kinase [Acholeplasmatales bacterium]MCK9234003.1 phosphoglycerate kinase [Acholeplasmataceae bacterium]MCK9289049.1 phosphoglycerate kinase [Acholeplasmataceae bacterium]MCK9427744.1 phosphoglycerate kinase [Acholeplasmataceae bacterium]